MSLVKGERQCDTHDVEHNRLDSAQVYDLKFFSLGETRSKTLSLSLSRLACGRAVG